VKILLLEDDKNLHTSLKIYFEMEGFEVVSAYSSDDVYAMTYEDSSYDLYVFDVNVQGDNGFLILKSLRSAEDKTPAIYITAMTDIASIGDGFNAGADDYIKKPFDPEELVIRIKSKYMSRGSIIYKNILYSPNSKELLMNDKLVTLSNIFRNIFHELIIQKGKIVPIDVLYELLDSPSSNALRVNISKLKNKLNLDIKNIRGVGYMLEEL
jgi:DNA-binding response OmpR family regulator